MGKVYIVKFTNGINKDTWLTTSSGGIHIFIDYPSNEFLINLLGEDFNRFKPVIESVTLEEIPELDYSTK